MNTTLIFSDRTITPLIILHVRLENERQQHIYNIHVIRHSYIIPH